MRRGVGAEKYVGNMSHLYYKWQRKYIKTCQPQLEKSITNGLFENKYPNELTNTEKLVSV